MLNKIWTLVKWRLCSILPGVCVTVTADEDGSLAGVEVTTKVTPSFSSWSSRSMSEGEAARMVTMDVLTEGGIGGGSGGSRTTGPARDCCFKRWKV